MLTFIQWCKKVVAKIMNDNITLYASQSTFFIVLSFLPFIMFLMTLVKFLPIDQGTLTEAVLTLVPSVSADTILSLITEVTRRSTGTLMSFTLIMLLWTSCKGIMALTNGINSVYGIRETRNYFKVRIISGFYTFIMALLILFSLIFLVYGNKIFNYMTQFFPYLLSLSSIVSAIRLCVAILFLTFFFMFFFKALPNKKLHFRHQIPGALFSAFSWLGSTYVFSMYVDFSKNLSYMYGSLTSIIILMLWLYFSMIFIFLGAELNTLIFGSFGTENPEDEELRY